MVKLDFFIALQEVKLPADLLFSASCQSVNVSNQPWEIISDVYVQRRKEVLDLGRNTKDSGN